MMHQPKTWVFSFKSHDAQTGSYVTAPFKSTLDRVQRVGGVVIVDTAEEVPLFQIDEDGRYDPAKDAPDAARPEKAARGLQPLLQAKLDSVAVALGEHGVDSDEFWEAWTEMEEVADRLRAILGVHGKSWA